MSDLKKNNTTKLRDILNSNGLNKFAVIDSYRSIKEEERFTNWLDNGYGAGMPYLQNRRLLKVDPEKLLKGCKSIIFVLLNYYQKKNDSPRDGGVVSRYAYGRDYHKVFSSKLKKIRNELKAVYPHEQFMTGSDTLPIFEKHYAAEADLGFIGKNTLLINKTYGSWLFIGEILSTRRFTPTISDYSIIKKCPDSCTLCIDACPTGALVSPYILDSTKCISYLNIENKGTIPKEYRPGVGRCIYGCDICQEVCPFNQSVAETEETGFLNQIAGSSLKLKDILLIKNDEDFIAKFAGSPLIRLKRAGLIRNACIVAGNSGLHELSPILKKLVNDPDPVISEHAGWAVEKMISKR